MNEFVKEPAWFDQSSEMFSVTVLYPETKGARFDLAYYTGKQMPMVRQKLGAALKGVHSCVVIPSLRGISNFMSERFQRFLASSE